MSNQIEVSVIVTPYKDGPEIATFVDELLTELKKLNRSWEVLMMESYVPGNSIETLKKYSDKYENFITVIMSHPGVAVTDKTNKYLLGFKMARGKYIITMDSDGQDVPAEIPQFLAKLDEGYDFVSGHKQKRKDGAFYMFTSKIANTLNRVLFKVKIHDMNCGFKGYRANIAKEMKLRGGLFRFIPAFMTARKLKITEVPVQHRVRQFGKPRFNFLSRLKGGLFDILTVYFLIQMAETPMYIMATIGFISFGVGILALLVSFFLSALYWQILCLSIFGVGMLLGFIAILLGVVSSYLLYHQPKNEAEFGLLEVYKK